MYQITYLSAGYFDRLHNYLSGLSPESRRRFGPHLFDRESIELFYRESVNCGYIAVEEHTGNIIGYAVVRKGFLRHDRERIEGYGLKLNCQTDATFAPSVADAWQGLGVGGALWRAVLHDLRSEGRKRVLLWGGVQADNEKAIHYYRKLGFATLGQFEYYGNNLDMSIDIA